MFNTLKQYGKNQAKKHPKLLMIYERQLFRYITSGIRLLPDFIIIGAQKSGTTSLYGYIMQHPYAFAAQRKEINFFTLKYHYGTKWYVSNFPTSLRRCINKITHKPFVTGEASPYYIFHPLAAERMKKLLPNVKLIIILRNPVDRAFSHYNHVITHQNEQYSFKDAISEESKRLEGEKERIESNPSYISKKYRSYSYLSRGRYIEQVEKWMNVFSKDQFLILRTEDLHRDTVGTVNQVFDFLGLPKFDSLNVTKRNVGNYEENLNLQTRELLIDYYKPYNEKLSSFLNMDFDWDK